VASAKSISYPIYDLQNQTHPVVGVDEAGRGCLAGPVCAAAVILKDGATASLFTDSKLLSAKRRDELFDIIFEQAYVGVGFASVMEIEKINILKASLLAMKRAIENLLIDSKSVKPGIVLVDGKFKIPDVAAPQVALIKGELRAPPIAAASIVAKVSRDRLMDKVHEEFPQYAFLQHKGYATEIHRGAIEKFGPTVHHRQSFAGVKEHLLRFPAVVPAN
jgi:ribonuclease HII